MTVITDRGVIYDQVLTDYSYWSVVVSFDPYFRPSKLNSNQIWWSELCNFLVVFWLVTGFGFKIWILLRFRYWYYLWWLHICFPFEVVLVGYWMTWIVLSRADWISFISVFGSDTLGMQFCLPCYQMILILCFLFVASASLDSDFSWLALVDSFRIAHKFLVRLDSWLYFLDTFEQNIGAFVKF